MKKDILISAILGFFSGLFFLLIVRNPQIEEFQELPPTLVNLSVLLPLIFPILFVAGMVIAAWMAQHILRLFYQVARFVEVGALNTLIDFGILNLLIWVTGVTEGTAIIPLNAFSFLIATSNSYFWNKFWTFQRKGAAKQTEFIQFLVVSGIGIAINTGIVYVGTTFLSPTFNLSDAAWANVMKICATIASLAWNFLGYKFIVFRTKTTPSRPV